MKKEKTILEDIVTGNRYKWILEGNDPISAIEYIINNSYFETDIELVETVKQLFNCSIQVVKLFKDSDCCPLKNSDYNIEENFTIPDIDGTILGIVLARNRDKFVTWNYAYFPKDDYFNGFNEGHYFDDYYFAYKDFCERCILKINRIKKITNEQEKNGL